MDRSAIKNMNADYFESRNDGAGCFGSRKPIMVVIEPLDVSMMDGLSPRQKGERMSMMARKAVIESARLSGLNEPRSFPKTEEGAPRPEDGVWWGLSHKPDVVAGAAHIRPVGLDVEVIRTVSARLIDRISTKKERILFLDSDDSLFFRIWTAKEAVLKVCGQGLSGMGSCFVNQVLGDDHIVVGYGGRLFPVTSLVRDTYIVSVISEPSDVLFLFKPGFGRDPVRV